MSQYNIVKTPLKVGIVGTGYAAARRAEAFNASPHTQLVGVSGNTPEKTTTFGNTHHVKTVSSWQDLINDKEIDLICVSNVNSLHGQIIKEALLADKHIIVEYPLTINSSEAPELLNLAKVKRKLLHIEHIELLGGVHQAIKQHIFKIGNPFLASYETILSKPKVAPHWTYNYHDYGFPLIAALSRINRFTDLFGEVATVSCNARFWDAPESGYFSACWCQAQLMFKNQVGVNITYGKGDKFARSGRVLTIYGDEGVLLFEGEKGKLIQGDKVTDLEVGSRRGLFTQDTELILEHLLNDAPIYTTNRHSVYTLQVANAALESYKSKQTLSISN
ncbi:Gfo/Idh/MocA family oxidoreductase [Cyanobacterium stanieri LEGE 03274]|uniref:Gfo/Idh/MocA family oxidoreductase n=1 Tax=Cyanobacterium stanieri LEGE 03274 TaxID=1828756 RepID=A0ABR9V261_9CHRO|nr:Gfo/Idh/MocA family oxidoreductase [Cyanobacterium stanieri]MBE9221980.1 Gfo/Idh/MocA family oxidoreductase [Cyanobacterium stanieri LEGE 03274]